MTGEIIDKFQAWWRQARADASLQHQGAACLSTIDAHGFPNARFVDLKAVTADGFVFCTALDSPKAAELQRWPKAALTLWWENLGYQVRVQGIATRLPPSQAEPYWQARPREVQLTTLCSQQSQPIAPGQSLRDRLAALRASLGKADIPMPANWGAYLIAPVSVEFLSFQDDRLHLREHYRLTDDGWKRQLLQP